MTNAGRKTRQKRLLKIVSKGTTFFTVTNGSVSDSRKEIIKRDKTTNPNFSKGTRSIR